MGQGFNIIDNRSQELRPVSDSFGGKNEELTTANLAGRLIAKAKKFKASGSGIDEKEFQELLRIFQLVTVGDASNTLYATFTKQHLPMLGLALRSGQSLPDM